VRAKSARKRGFAIPATPVVLTSNILLVFIVVASFLSLDSYEKSLLQSLEHALSQQGRVLASWLGEAGLDEKSAKRAIAALKKEHTARIRVVDAEGLLLADSSAMDGSAGDGTEESGAWEGETRSPERSVIYRVLSAPVRLAKRWFMPPEPPFGVADSLTAVNGRLYGPEVRSALSGSYGSATRISSGGQVSVTLYAALPVFGARTGSRVSGAVILSQSTFRILQSLYALRIQVGRVFLAGLIAASILSIALSLFFSGPLRSLARQARGAAERGAPPGAHFTPPGPGAEARELFEALAEYSSRLGERIGWAERFAQDAAHELRNPIASVRAAAEYLLESMEGGVPPPDARERLESVMADAMRMDRILRGLRRLSRLDAASGVAEFAAAWPLLENLASRMAPPGGIELRAGEGAERALVSVESERFVLAVETVLDNALSFSPRGSTVIASCGIEGGRLVIRVADSGPGIQEGHLGRIFDRFFSYRPGSEGAADHSGLGLSIAKAVMDAAGGEIRAENRTEGGAVFTLSFPIALKSGQRPKKFGKKPS
jgi:two-component system, OmpR family, sensor histidine kinase ChvG